MTSDKSVDSSNPLYVTQESLASIVGTLLHLGIIVHDFQGTDDAKVGLTSLTNQLIGQLKELNTSADSLTDVPIPLDVLQYIEDGRNPDVYTREFVESVRNSNQYLKGKTEAFKRLRDNLGEQISKEFPELEADVSGIIERTNIESN